jgi:hypothetical protein
MDLETGQTLSRGDPLWAAVHTRPLQERLGSVVKVYPQGQVEMHLAPVEGADIPASYMDYFFRVEVPTQGLDPAAVTDLDLIRSWEGAHDLIKAQTMTENLPEGWVALPGTRPAIAEGLGPDRFVMGEMDPWNWQVLNPQQTGSLTQYMTIRGLDPSGDMNPSDWLWVANLAQSQQLGVPARPIPYVNQFDNPEGIAPSARGPGVRGPGEAPGGGPAFPHRDLERVQRPGFGGGPDEFSAQGGPSITPDSSAFMTEVMGTLESMVESMALGDQGIMDMLGEIQMGGERSSQRDMLLELLLMNQNQNQNPNYMSSLAYGAPRTTGNPWA